MTEAAHQEPTPFAARKPNGFPRAVRLRDRRDFVRVERGGVRGHSTWITAVVRPGRGRIGLTVSRKVGNSVARNRVKRWLREELRHHKQVLAGLDVVFILKPDAATAAREVLLDDAAKALADARTALSRSKPPSSRRSR
jgi:ribonuclease P protein component